MLLESSASHAFICDDVRFPNELELFTSMAREVPEGKKIGIYLHHWKYTQYGNTDHYTGYLKPKSLLGGHPSEDEHPSEFLLDLPSNCYDHVWDCVYVPSFGRIPPYAMMSFDHIMKDYND